MFGKEIYKNGGSYPVLPGKSLDMKYESTLSSFFGGWYTIEAGIAYDKRAEKYGLTDSSQLTYIHSPTRRILVAPHPGAVLGLAVIVGICIYVILRRKRRTHFSSSRSFRRR